MQQDYTLPDGTKVFLNKFLFSRFEGFKNGFGTEVKGNLNGDKLSDY